MKLKTGMILITALILQLSAKTVSANQENVKGLLPEVRLNSNNEDQNNEKAFQSELMITKAENKAIESLNKTGTRNSPRACFYSMNFRLKPQERRFHQIEHQRR